MSVKQEVAVGAPMIERLKARRRWLSDQQHEMAREQHLITQCITQLNTGVAESVVEAQLLAQIPKP